MRRRIVVVVATVALIAVVAVGLSQTGTENRAPQTSTVSAAEQRRALTGAPAALAALHAESGRILGGGRDAMRRRLAALRGHPVVVNKWASWCGPCRFEFPFLQETAVAYGKRVAFLGLNSGDNRGEALAFLREYPVPYPHYDDPDEKVAFDLGASAAYPVTLFYDRRGKRTYIHQGGYPTKDKLVADIERYALR